MSSKTTLFPLIFQKSCKNDQEYVEIYFFHKVSKLACQWISIVLFTAGYRCNRNVSITEALHFEG